MTTHTDPTDPLDGTVPGDADFVTSSDTTTGGGDRADSTDGDSAGNDSADHNSADHNSVDNNETESGSASTTASEPGIDPQTEDEADRAERYS